MTRLTGSVAFVTGSGQGVGEAIAHRLAEAEATKIVLADRSVDQLNRVAADLSLKGIEVLPCPMDLQDVASLRAAVTTAEDRFGRIDILVNAAGTTERGGLLDTTPEAFDRIFNTNVRGNFFLMQAIARGMADRKSGVIINISTMLAHGGVAHLLTYSASKAALNLMTRNIAHSMRFDRVRVHAINLGWTVTPAERITQTQVHDLPDDWDEQEGSKQPFGRLLNPEDPAGLCVFLASKDAEMMTGNVIDLEQWVSGVLG